MKGVKAPGPRRRAREKKGSCTKIKPVKNQPFKPPLTPEIPGIKTLSKHYLIYLRAGPRFRTQKENIFLAKRLEKG
jgi:hypothetical protein